MIDSEGNFFWRLIETTPFVTINGHSDDTYNGIYYLAEPWGGSEHYSKLDRSSHFYNYND